MDSPNRVHLPSGRVLDIRSRDGLGCRSRRPGAPLFSEMVELATSGDLALYEQGNLVDVGALELRDFHALRAIATRIGWLPEDPIEFPCRNCGETTRQAPCAALELAPFVDGELDDPELDLTLDLSQAHAIAAIPLGDGSVAFDALLTQVTVATAAPLHRALRGRNLFAAPRASSGHPMSEAIVRAMGIVSLGTQRDARRIALALRRCSDEAWSEIGDLFLEAHYPPRLRSIVLCGKCGARNDVDAPYEREFEPTQSLPPSNAQPFPDFDAFDTCARDAFERMADDQVRHVTLVVDANVPACDDGGEPLLGAYVPPGGEPLAQVGLAEITVYYRSFQALWDEDGPYDWQSELRATIDHELEHHLGWRTGHDPMDDEEREEIAREHAALVGRRQTARASVAAMGEDVGGFIVRTWPIWLIVAAWAIGISVCGK
jgi:hypothetical protein